MHESKTFLYMVPPYFLMETFTCAFDQQHWNPRPPSPDQSLASTFNTYSPGSLNVAVVDALPLNTGFAAPCTCALSIVGWSLAKVTLPGPRNLVRVRVTAGVLGRVAPGITLASSATQRSKGTGFDRVPESACDCPRGPFTNGPA